MRNTSLYKSLREFYKEALAILNEKLAKKQDLPITVKEKFEFKEDGGYSQSYEPEILWYIFVDKNVQELKKTDIYCKLVRALQDDPQIARHLDTLVGTHEFRMRLDVDICLRALITKLFQEQEDITFEESIFNKVYEEFESYFYRDRVECRLISPLNNFQAESERIELSPGFSIIKIPKEERAEMLSSSRMFGAFPQYQVMPFNEYAFELVLEIPKLFGENAPVRKAEDIPSQIAQKQFYEACSALRLFKEGAVNHEYIRVGTISWELHGGTFTTDSVSRQKLIGPQYILSKDDISDFLKFWSFFQKVRQKTRRRINLALRRFNFAYERVRPEDKLIDYMIGFESLLLLGTERQELEYRLALRGSALLNNTPEGRAVTFKELKTAYRERSNIVHGGILKEIIKIDNNEVKFSEFVDKAGKLLRSSIQEFLQLTESRSEAVVLDELDKRIICGQ